MARNSNILTRGLHGTIGKSVVFKKINGENVATTYPDRSQVKFTKKQEGYQNILAQAAAYASAILKDPEKTDAYIQKIRTGSSSKRKMSVYHYAVQEFMKQHSKKVPVNDVMRQIEKYPETFEPGERGTMVLKYLAKQKEMSNADYPRMTGVSKPTATRHLTALVQEGLICRSSRGAGAVYVLNPLVQD